MLKRIFDAITGKSRAEELVARARLAAEERSRREEELRKLAAAEKAVRRRRFVDRLASASFLEGLSALEFERLVLSVFRAEGWLAEETKASGDEGIDGWLKRPGKMAILQCKHKRQPVGQPTLRDFYGATVKARAAEGFLVTSGTFSEQARTWVAGLTPEIHLISREQILSLVKQHRLGLTEEHDEIELPKEPECRICGAPMKLLGRRRRLFWGCSRFPDCRWVKALNDREERYARLGAWPVRRVRSRRRW